MSGDSESLFLTARGIKLPTKTIPFGVYEGYTTSIFTGSNIQSALFVITYLALLKFAWYTWIKEFISNRRKKDETSK